MYLVLPIIESDARLLRHNLFSGKVVAYLEPVRTVHFMISCSEGRDFRFNDCDLVRPIPIRWNQGGTFGLGTKISESGFTLRVRRLQYKFLTAGDEPTNPRNLTPGP